MLGQGVEEDTGDHEKACSTTCRVRYPARTDTRPTILEDIHKISMKIIFFQEIVIISLLMFFVQFSF